MLTLCLHTDGIKTPEYQHVQNEPIIFPYTWYSTRVPYLRRWHLHLSNCTSPKPKSHCIPPSYKYPTDSKFYQFLPSSSFCPLHFLVFLSYHLDYWHSLLIGVPHLLLPLQTVLHTKLFKFFYVFQSFLV